MTLGRLPLDEQRAAVQAVLSRNDVLREVLGRTASLELPGRYVTGGRLFQTVWNVVTDRPPTQGIKDYDLFCFDDGDLSWEAEDTVIRAGKEVFAGLPAEVEIRNQARVRLWYEQKSGVARTPHDSTEAAIGGFAATTCCPGKRPGPRTGGASTHPTASPTSSTSSYARTRCSLRAKSARPRRLAGGSGGPN
ncbi:hypothetical protein SUDANB176_04789 [Streptomyces sp. enrichment culture]